MFISKFFLILSIWFFSSFFFVNAVANRHLHRESVEFQLPPRQEDKNLFQFSSQNEKDDFPNLYYNRPPPSTYKVTSLYQGVDHVRFYVDKTTSEDDYKIAYNVWKCLPTTNLHNTSSKYRWQVAQAEVTAIFQNINTDPLYLSEEHSTRVPSYIFINPPDHIIRKSYPHYTSPSVDDDHPTDDLSFQPFTHIHDYTNPFTGDYPTNDFYRERSIIVSDEWSLDTKKIYHQPSTLPKPIRMLMDYKNPLGQFIYPTRNKRHPIQDIDNPYFSYISVDSLWDDLNKEDFLFSVIKSYGGDYYWDITTSNFTYNNIAVDYPPIPIPILILTPPYKKPQLKESIVNLYDDDDKYGKKQVTIDYSSSIPIVHIPFDITDDPFFSNKDPLLFNKDPLLFNKEQVVDYPPIPIPILLESIEDPMFFIQIDEKQLCISLKPN